MESLSTDVFYAIVHELWFHHRQSILDVTLVCKGWHEIAQSVLERDIDNLIIAPLTKKRNGLLFQRIKSDVIFRRRLRRLCVVDVFSSGIVPVHRTGFGMELNFRGRGQNEYGYLEEESPDTWDQIVSLANLMPRLYLVAFRWKAKPNIPGPIIDALDKMKDCKVQIRTRADDREEFYNSSFAFESILTWKGLMGLNSIAHNLRVLEVIIPAPGVSRRGMDMLDVLGRLVHISPLDNLGIHAAGRLYPWSQSRDGPSTRYTFGTVREFRWLFDHADSAQKKLNLKGLRLTNFCLCRADEDAIRSMRNLFKWETLQKGHFTCPMFLQVAAEQDVQLRSLYLHLDNPDDGARSCVDVPDINRLQAFLASQRNLHTLEISNGSQVFDSLNDEEDMSLFEALGRSLYSLIVRENEKRGMSPNHKRPLLSQNAMQQMGEKFSHLRTLALNLPFVNDMMFDHLSIIAKSFPSLYEVELNLEIEKPWEKLTRTPVSKDFCRQIWDRFCTDSCTGSLRRMTVSVGAMSAGERLEEFNTRWPPLHRRYVIEMHPEVESQSPVVKMVELEEFNRRLCLDQNARYKGLCKVSLHPELEGLMEEGLV